MLCILDLLSCMVGMSEGTLLSQFAFVLFAQIPHIQLMDGQFSQGDLGHGLILFSHANIVWIQRE